MSCRKTWLNVDFHFLILSHDPDKDIQKVEKIAVIIVNIHELLQLLHEQKELNIPSFDIVNEIDIQKLDNAINVAKKEIVNRYDFHGSKNRN